MSGLRIGDVEIPARVLTAPMTGVSDLPFRRAASRLGAAYVATEMVACETFVNGRPDVVRRAAVGDGLPLTVIQLVGREARFIARAAEIAEDAGADIIDLNMGCPCKEVTGGLSGSALMRDLDHAERLIDAALGATVSEDRLPIVVFMTDGVLEAVEADLTTMSTLRTLFAETREGACGVHRLFLRKFEECTAGRRADDMTLVALETLADVSASNTIEYAKAS